MVLDLVEVAESHTGENLGITFTTVLKNFGLEEKVRALDVWTVIRGGHLPALHVAGTQHNRR